MSEKYFVNFLPTEKEISEIETWLIEENKKKKEGFYCNWNSIKSSFVQNEIVTITYQNKAIGFATFHSYSKKTVKIEIVEIKPSCRKKGIGKILIGELFNHFKSSGIFVAYLNCSPSSSEPIWKRLGFIEYPSLFDCYSSSFFAGKKLFQILTEYLDSSNIVNINERIELWEDEPLKAIQATPKYIWHIDFIAGTRKLKTPIIHLVEQDWRIRWMQNGNVIKDDKVKYFEPEVQYGEFLIIDELPLAIL